MNILIADVHTAVEIIEKKPQYYRVVSIAGSGNPLELAQRKKISQAKEILYLDFDDITEELIEFARDSSKYQPATEEDCRGALEFLQQSGPLLVHCYAGVSRSTAIVLGHLLKVYPRYRDAVDKLLELRSQADPNSHVVKLMCKILGRSYYREIMAYIRTARRRHVEAKTDSYKSPVKKIDLYFRKEQDS